MFKHYLITALRHFRRFKGSTAISVIGLSLGLACFVAAMGVVTYLTHGEQQFANAGRIYAIAEGMHPRGTQTFDFASLRSSPPVARHLRADIPELTAVATARDVQEIPVAANERLGYLRAAAVDPEFLTIFDFSFIESTTKNPLSAPRGAVITEETAQSLFGSTHVLGRVITLRNAYDVTINGVIRAVQQPSHIGASSDHILRFDILLTEETYWQFRRAENPNLPVELPFSGDSWGSPVSFTYVLVPADGSLTASMLNDRLHAFTKKYTAASRNARMNFTHTAVPIASLRLTQLDVDLFKGNGLSLATLILMLAAIVLGVACINYANLATAQARIRTRELGLRRVLGANAVQIAVQQWIDSGLQLFAALSLAVPLAILGMIWFSINGFGDGFASTMSRVVSTWAFWTGVVTAGVAAAFVLGTYTTLVILRAHPASALRGSKEISGNGSLTRVLVGVQFATASLLIIALVVVRAQNDVVRDQALRLHSDPVIVLEFPGRDANLKFDTVKDALLRSNAVREVSGIIRTPWSTRESSITSISTEPGATLHNTFVDFVRYDFERVLGTPMLAGRSFDPIFKDSVWSAKDAQDAETFPIVIDRATAKTLGWPNPGDAIDRVVYWPTFNAGQYARFQIIGVADDNPLRFDAGPGAHLQVYALAPNAGSNIIVRVDKNRVAEALAAIDATWKSFAPYAPVKRHFMDELFEREYRTLQRTNDALAILTILGFVIAAMGLFALATFIATRRRHEIGVRKTLGASAGQVVSMLLRDFSKPVLIANLIAWPLGYIVANEYLSRFVERIALTPTPFVLSLLLTLLVAWLAVGGHAWRAARLKPSDVLRHE